MLLVLVCLVAAAAAAPATYDQRQDGEFNVQADVQNIMIVLAIPKKMNSLLDMFTRSHRPAIKEPELQNRADVQIMEAFVEPNTPYRVEIGSERSADGRAAEVVIAGRRRMDSEEPELDEFKLLGATEQCGPDRVRDPVTLICKFPESEKVQESDKDNDEVKSQTTPDKIETQPTPEVIST